MTIVHITERTPPSNGSALQEHSSALIRSARVGTSRLCAVFGGQGGNNRTALDDLIELKKSHGAILETLLEIATRLLSELSSQPHKSSFHAYNTFDLSTWIEHPECAPPRGYLSLSPISFPVNTLLSLAQYCITCHNLDLHPGEFRSSLNGALGHSQGLFAAVSIAKSHGWGSFYKASEEALRLSFWVGLESHHAAPASTTSAVAVNDCVDHGEGSPTSMLSISGLNHGQILNLVERVNHSRAVEDDEVQLALINSRDKFVLAGTPQALRAVCIQLRGIKASEGLDQTRIVAHKRKQNVEVQFLPISAPYHSRHLGDVQAKVLEHLHGCVIARDDLEIPVYHTSTGKNLQRMQSGNLLGVIIRAVTTDMVDWPRVCQAANATHVLDFGPGLIGGLNQELGDGTGLHIVQMTDRPGLKGMGNRSDLLSKDISLPCPNWKQRFGPQIWKDEAGNSHLRTRMTKVFGTPPIMVGGMTPTTVPWKFVSEVMRAGHHIELAAGGYSNEKDFEAAIRKLANSVPPHRGITCNLIYAKPKTIGWQVSTLRKLVNEGIHVDGLTIGAGIPSLDVVRNYIENLGLRHISFKPGSLSAIGQVINIAEQYPEVPIGLQWTGGRAGGHHSWEDFHEPILRAYGRIRKCANIVLIAGSGFGDGASSFPYLSGEWANAFGYPAMPFDGILLGSRMMVAREAHTSLKAKQLIVQAKGVEDKDWHSAFDRPTGGVITVTSEMGQPIHVLATRGMLLWKDLDERVFSIRDSTKRVAYLRSRRNDIVSRLNRDYCRPWFAINESGENVEIEDLTYLDVLRRLCQLTYVHHQTRWIDASYRQLVDDYIRLVEERFGRVLTETSAHKPANLIKAFAESIGPYASDLLYPDDVSRLLALFSHKGQKPVPFIPRLDDNFETWFKKDSLWQSEDVDAVPEQDVQRVCIIHGPVAARYSTSYDETAATILDTICKDHIQRIQTVEEGSTCQPVPRGAEVPDHVLDGVQIVEIDKMTRKYEISLSISPSDLRLLVDHVAGTADSWLGACLSEEWMFRGSSRVKNPIRAAFKPQPGDSIIARHNDGPTASELSISSSSSTSSGETTNVIGIALKDQGVAIVSLVLTSPSNTRGFRLGFPFELRSTPNGFKLYQGSSEYLETVRALYSHLWIKRVTPDLQVAGLSSEFTGDRTVISKTSVEEYMDVVRRSPSPQVRSWNPKGSVPVDFCIVLAWKALTKPLMVPALNCDLLKLLHRSIRFCYAPLAEPLKFGDVVTTSSRISALVIKSAGKLIEVTADIKRNGELVVSVKSEFFVQGKFSGSEKQFKSMDEPAVTLTVDTQVMCSLLLSRKWLTFEDPSLDIMGTSLSFHLSTHTVFGHESGVALLQVSGTVVIENHNSTPTRIGQVYFEQENCTVNPVMEFIHRHGTPRVVRRDLEHPGWTEMSPIMVQAPSPAASASYSIASHDTNPIHTCPAFARYAGLSGSVVHGMHTSAIVRRAIEWAIGDADRRRFRSWEASFEDVVHHNDWLRVELKHVAVQDGSMVFAVRAFNQKTGDKVLEAEALVEQPPTAYVFCGQGSQEKGMGMALYSARPEAKALWHRGDAHLRANYGFSLLEIVRQNPQSLTVHFGGKRGRRIRANYLAMTKLSSGGQEEPILPGLTSQTRSYTFSYPKGLLFSTQFSQPALALMEMVEYAHLEAQGVVQRGSRFAGHSLGEYGALGACTTFMPFENLMSLIFYRGLKMQNALARDASGCTDYSMMAVDPSRIGKDFNENQFELLVQLIAQETDLLLEVVNFNISGQQYVCAGHIQALWILGQLCDALSSQSLPRVDVDTTRDMVRRHIPSSKRLSNKTPLSRGKATIPLSGIDIPFHSTMLRGAIDDYRKYLRRTINVADVKPDELVGRWIPNVVGQPFSLEPSYVERVQEVTGSDPLRRLLSTMVV
ncbi:putative Fatty acid synthase beta subunit hexB [Seiridium unicorne]|uniref:Fatty acid synthase beta subunit hexB n=1 Tax=Seiridium unicorne TaxID=138068 RepID=A0ABR2VIM6_9PEZI